MSDKLAVVLMDALGPYNIYDHQLLNGFETIRGLYKNNGEVLGISTLPHTAQSNPMIWGGVYNRDKFWVEPKNEGEWIDPSTLFEHRGHEHNRPDAHEYRNYTRQDFDEKFIWDVLDHYDLDPVAIQIPIVLPPYSYNADRVDHESWFPDTQERMSNHVREKPEIIMEHAEEGYDFIASSIQMPDKWFHGIPEGKCDEKYVVDESYVLDQKVSDMVDTFESEGYDWVIAGDHGSPCPGKMPVHEARTMLPRHRKEAVIFGSEGIELPRYTANMYNWMLNYFGLPDETVDVDHSKEVGVHGIPASNETSSKVDGNGRDGPSDEVVDRLRGLGYM